MNYLWGDGETTGLNPVENDIIQWACIPVIAGKIQPHFNEFFQPIRWDNIDQGAVDVHGITVDMMKTFQKSEEALEKFIAYLDSFGEKFIIAGFNIEFDKRFLSSWFAKHNRSDDFSRLFDVDTHCTFKRWKSLGRLAPTLVNNKLETIANHYGIQINAHDALSDIMATIEVDKIVAKLRGEDDYEYQSSVDLESISITSQFKPLPQLHIHSQYSLGMAVPKPKEWKMWCAQNNVPAFSCVDHGSGISLYEMIKIKDSDVTPIPGLGMHVRFPGINDVLFGINAWATSNDGYFNLLKLASIGFESAVEYNGTTTPVLTIDQIKQFSRGLKFGVGGYDSIFAYHLLNDQLDKAKEAYSLLLSSFGEDIYFEVTPVDIIRLFDGKVGFTKLKRTGCIPEANLGKALNNFIVDCSEIYGGKVIPVSGAFFIDPEDKVLQTTLMKNRNKDNAYFHESYHVRTAEEIYKVLKTHLGDRLDESKFDSWITNCYEVSEPAKSIEIKFQYHMPHIDIPAHIQQKTPDYDTQTFYYMMELCKEHGRWSDDPVYVSRFKQEVDVIMKNKAMNFIPYFLLYEDLGRYARSQGFLQNIARGSAGGCLISYYLKIIHVDPIKADLPFERFLSHARINAGSWPDIDMDISRSARPHVMKYLKQKYGMGFAQIATLSTMKTKNAIKDTMMAVYGRNRNDNEIKAICDTIPDSPQGVSEEDFLYGYEDNEGTYHTGLLELNQDLQRFFDRYPDVASIVKRLIGIVRGWSRHASAFVVSTLDLSSTRCPTMMMYDNHMGEYIQVTQYDAKMAESVGLVKADILGLKTLDVVTDCVNLVKKRIGTDYLDEIGFQGVPLLYRLEEDQNVYADFFNKATDSSFQFNTPLIKGYIQEFAPNRRGHLKDMTALCRPGALDAEWEPGVSAAQYYLDVRNNKRELSFVHNDLAPLLRDTNGVFVYQEQVMKFLVDFGGHTLEESDVIRGAIAKKKRDVIQRAFDRVRNKTKELGWAHEQTEKVCHQIEAFARYSFNLSHSHAYAELGYITMYLKHHHPLEWWCSVLNNEDDDDKFRHYITILGDTVISPSLMAPSDKFQIKGDKILSPISVVKGVGPKAVETLVENGPFGSIEEYIQKVNHTACNIGALGQLIKARAADDFFDKSLPYGEARRKFMQDFITKRKTTSSFKDELTKCDPISIFLMERETNKTFNKTVLSDPDLKKLILHKWNSLTPTGNRNIPFQTIDGTLVLSGVRMGQALLKSGSAENKNFAMVMMYEGSSVKQGVSKKGNKYCFTKIQLSDGFNSIEAVDWNRQHPLRYPINSLVYVEGTLKEGWKTPLSLVISQIEIIV